MLFQFVISAVLAIASAAPEAKPHIGGSLSSLPQHHVGVLPQAPIAVGTQLPLDVPAGHINLPAHPIDVPAPLPVGVRAHLPVQYGAHQVPVQAHFPAALRTHLPAAYGAHPFPVQAHFPGSVRTFETPALVRAAETVAFPSAHHFEGLVHHGPVFRQQPVVGYPALLHHF